MKQTITVHGKKYNLGDVVFAEARFIDSYETKMRPAFVLFEEHNNVILVAITSNQKMDGVPLYKSEGALEDSMIKTNYIFTVDSSEIHKKFFTVSESKKKEVCENLLKKLNA